MVVTTSGPRRPGRSAAASPSLQGFVDALPLPALLLDKRGRIVALNDAWRRAARPGGLIAPTDKVGKDHIHDLREEKGFSRAAGRAMADAIEDVLAGRRPQASHAYRLETEAGVRRWKGTVSPLHLDDAEHALVIHQDTTAEERAAAMAARVADLMIAQERSAAVARDRQRLLDAAQQSFHAPLTPIRLQMHLLRGGKLGELSERQAKALERIDRNVQRWWRLQEGLLDDLTMLESPDHVPVDALASELLEEALQPFRERALKAGVRLRVDIAAGDMHVHIDPRATVQVLMLLLDNAIRQSPSGGLVWVRLRRVDRTVELVVQDQDPTMDPADAEALLADESDQESTLRSGLLHAQATLARDDARIQARCAGPGRGLEVVVSFPLDH